MENLEKKKLSRQTQILQNESSRVNKQKKFKISKSNTLGDLEDFREEFEKFINPLIKGYLERFKTPEYKNVLQSIKETDGHLRYFLEINNRAKIQKFSNELHVLTQEKNELEGSLTREFLVKIQPEFILFKEKHKKICNSIFRFRKLVKNQNWEEELKDILLSLGYSKSTVKNFAISSLLSSKLGI